MNRLHTKKGWITVLMVAVLAFGSTLTAWAATRLDTVSDVWWDEDNSTVAIWEEVEDAYQYEVYLYCNDSRMATIKTKKLRYDFERKMTKEGEYTFRVRALARGKDFRDSYWSDYSDSIYIDEAFAELMKSGGKIDTANSGPGAGGQQSETAPAAGVVYTGKWIQNEKGWWYERSDGFYPTNGWFQDLETAKWYFFNAEGYMMTGWIDWNGSRYYCQPDGAMVTGAYTVDGTAYQFDASGALLGA